MTRTHECRHVSVAIARTAREVYAYASDPRNLPHWASGLGSKVTCVDGQWTAQSPMGEVHVAFAPQNEFGVLDHDVTLPSGEVVHNPMRVIRNGDGAEVMFTLVRRGGMGAKQFEDDATWVQRDLEKLKSILEDGR